MPQEHGHLGFGGTVSQKEKEHHPKSSVLFSTLPPFLVSLSLTLRSFTILSRALFTCDRKNRSKDKAQEAKAASELITREAAQERAEGVMDAVVKAQDRLIGALQAELGMTSRAREAAEVRGIFTCF